MLYRYKLYLNEVNSKQEGRNPLKHQVWNKFDNFVRTHQDGVSKFNNFVKKHGVLALGAGGAVYGGLVAARSADKNMRNNIIKKLQQSIIKLQDIDCSEFTTKSAIDYCKSNVDIRMDKLKRELSKLQGLK